MPEGSTGVKSAAPNGSNNFEKQQQRQWRAAATPLFASVFSLLQPAAADKTISNSDKLKIR